MKIIATGKIRLDKPLNELDKLVLSFIRIVEKHIDYVIISGYVSILFGRSRSTEDVDLFIKPIQKELFIRLYNDLKENGFWCLNAESDEEVYNYLQEGLAIRFARKNETIPNFEVKIAKGLLNLSTFSDAITVETDEGKIIISSLERQIAFKRYFLKSPKDLEDARHVEQLFKDHLDKEKIKNYKTLIEKEYGKT